LSQPTAIVTRLTRQLVILAKMITGVTTMEGEDGEDFDEGIKATAEDLRQECYKALERHLGSL
jgi:hypothetical protein